MLVLVVNAGSSSLKSQLIDPDTGEVSMKCLAEKATRPGAYMNVSFAPGWQKERFDLPGATVPQFLEKLVHVLENDPQSPIGDLREIAGVGNRIVAGGEWFTHSVIVDDEARANLTLCEELAPLHNPSADACIDMMRELMPDTPQVCVFDTAFHSHMPKKSYLFPLPLRYYEDYKIRRYGAHGTSHAYATERAAALLGRPLEGTRIITCHLGNGGSISAVLDGTCIDTSMGLTPLDGIMMGTRTGAMDPAVVPYIMRREGMTPDEVDDLMNKHSGLLGITGHTDMRDVCEMAEAGDELGVLALDMYVFRVVKYIGSYFAILGGCDALVFTAGIGENSAVVRKMVCDELAHMGFLLDDERNAARGGDRQISADGSPVAIYVVPAEEEMCIAREVERLVR